MSWHGLSQPDAAEVTGLAQARVRACDGREFVAEQLLGLEAQKAPSTVRIATSTMGTMPFSVSSLLGERSHRQLCDGALIHLAISRAAAVPTI